jgi:hypothetical protein
MAHCRVLLCNINKKSGCQDGGFLSISNKDLVTFHFSLAIYHFIKKGDVSHATSPLNFIMYYPITFFTASNTRSA